MESFAWIFQRSSLNHRLRKRNVSPSRDNQILQMISGLPVQSAYTILFNYDDKLLQVNRKAGEYNGSKERLL